MSICTKQKSYAYYVTGLRCPRALVKTPVAHVKTFCCDLDIEKRRADKTVVTTTIRLRLDRRSTATRMQFDRATTIRRPTSRPRAYLCVCGLQSFG